MTDSLPARCDCLASVVAHQEDCANPDYIHWLEDERERLLAELVRLKSSRRPIHPDEIKVPTTAIGIYEGRGGSSS